MTLSAYLTAQTRDIEGAAADLAEVFAGLGDAEVPPMIAARATVILDKIAGALERIAGRIADAGPVRKENQELHP